MWTPKSRVPPRASVITFRNWVWPSGKKICLPFWPMRGFQTYSTNISTCCTASWQEKCAPSWARLLPVSGGNQIIRPCAHTFTASAPSACPSVLLERASICTRHSYTLASSRRGARSSQRQDSWQHQRSRLPLPRLCPRDSRQGALLQFCPPPARPFAPESPRCDQRLAKVLNQCDLSHFAEAFRIEGFTWPDAVALAAGPQGPQLLKVYFPDLPGAAAVRLLRLLAKHAEETSPSLPHPHCGAAASSAGDMASHDDSPSRMLQVHVPDEGTAAILLPSAPEEENDLQECMPNPEAEPEEAPASAGSLVAKGWILNSVSGCVHPTDDGVTPSCHHRAIASPVLLSPDAQLEGFSRCTFPPPRPAASAAHGSASMQGAAADPAPTPKRRRKQ